MISKSYWFLGVYLCFLMPLHGQFSDNDRVLAEYNDWLKQGSVGRLFEAKNVSVEDGFWALSLTSKKDFSDPKRMALSWSYLIEEYEGLGLSLPEQLLAKWARVSGRSPDSVYVKIICAEEAAFEVQILREAGIVKTLENINTDRDIGVRPYREISDVIFSNPGTCIVVMAKSKQMLDSLIPALERFFMPEEEVGAYKFERVVRNKASITLHASGLRRVITPSYFENLTLELSWAEFDTSGTELCYEFSAEYGSGIFRSGKFQDVKHNYATELLTYYEKLRRFISANLTK